MPTPFATALSAAQGALQASNGEEVTYCRGDSEVELTAIVIHKDVEQVSAYEILVEVIEQWDFLIRATDLVIGGVVILPVAGDRIRRVVGSITQTLEVMSQRPEPHYRVTEAGGEFLRVHAKWLENN